MLAVSSGGMMGVLLGKKTLEAEILKEALEHATSSKRQLRLPPLPPKDDTR